MPSPAYPLPTACGAQPEEINGTNFLNGRKIKLIVQDNASDKNQIITLTSRCATVDNAVAIIGPLSSLEALAAAPVANEKGIVMISTGVSPDILKAGPWSFKIMSPPVVTMRALAE